MEKVKPSIADVRKAAAIYFQMSQADLVSDAQDRRVAYPRMMAMCVARRMGGASLPSIGRAFGGRDHTTVMSAIAKVDRLPKMQAAADGVALLSARMCIERRARESAWIYQAIKLGQIVPAAVESEVSA